jgi:hypothetical protein
MDNKIEKKIELNAPIARVWRALTDYREFGEWFRVEKTATGTLLVLTESGFEKVPADWRGDAFRGNDGGWTQQMKNIESYVSSMA